MEHLHRRDRNESYCQVKVTYMKIDNDVFKGLFRDMWNMVMESKDMDGTEAEWEKLLEDGKKITNDPRYAPVQDLAIAWINNYVSWLDARTRALPRSDREKR